MRTALQSPPPAFVPEVGVTGDVPLKGTRAKRPDPTTALRSRRHRARKAAAKASAAASPPALPARAGDAKLHNENKGNVTASPIHKTTFCAALMLAVVSGGYSIFGLAHIFTGAALPVIGMGLALECGPS
jgi:hypothetical protein